MQGADRRRRQIPPLVFHHFSCVQASPGLWLATFELCTAICVAATMYGVIIGPLEPGIWDRDLVKKERSVNLRLVLPGLLKNPRKKIGSLI